MNESTLKISFDYLQSENLKGNYIHDWIKAYAKRNKINLTTENIPTGMFYGDTEPYIVIHFKSENQKDCFVRNGNRTFPYFEFW